MARIPLVQSAPQLDTGNQTVRIPQLQAGQGGEAMARGMQDIANVSMRIGELQRRANDVKNLTEADIAMRNELLSFSEWQTQNQDETQWLPEWQRRQKNLESQFGKMSITPDARLRLNDRFTQWSTGATIDVRSSAIKQTGARMQAATQQAFEYGTRTGDFEPAAQSIQDQLEAGLILPEQAGLELERVESAKLRKEASDYKTTVGMLIDDNRFAEAMEATGRAKDVGVLTQPEYEAQVRAIADGEKWYQFGTAATGDPRKAMEMLDKNEFGFDPMETEKARKMAESQLKDYQARETSEIADKFATGKIKSSKDIVPNWLSPAQTAELKELADKRPLTEAEWAAQRVMAERLVRGYDKSADPDRLQMVQISAMLDKFPKHLSGDLAQVWEGKKRDGKPPSNKDLYISSGLKYIEQLYKPKLEALLKKDGSITKGKEAEFLRLQMEQTDLRDKLERRMSDEVTPGEATRQIQDVLTLPVAERVRDYFGAGYIDGAANPLLAPTTNNVNNLNQNIK